MIAVVTGTLDWPTAKECAHTWLKYAKGPVQLYIVGQKLDAEVHTPGWEDLARSLALPDLRMWGYKTPDILGAVPAFAVGVAKALEDGHEIIACLHDDLDIGEPAWDTYVLSWFRTHPNCGLLGFGGGIGLGAMDIYRTPYDPMQLARRGFVSNMRDANAHGARSLQPVKVACLDGFSQIGRREYWEGQVNPAAGITTPETYKAEQLFQVMADWGITHHAYDSALGCFAKRLGWEAWMLPIACHHYGGRTAVGNTAYQEWANRYSYKTEEGALTVGDQAFWTEAHKIVYEQFRDCLPIN